MARLPQIKPRQLGKILERHGYKAVRQTGGHRIYQNGSVIVSVPQHNKDLKKGTLNAILKTTGLQSADLR